MSTEKGELMGITRAELEDAAKKVGSVTENVALAAQKAMLREIDVLAELVDCEDAWQSIRAKLRVKENTMKESDRVRIIDYSEAHGDTGTISTIQPDGLLLVWLDQGCIWPVTAEEIELI